DGIALHKSQPTQRGRQVPRIIDLGELAVAMIHGEAGIDQQPPRNTRLDIRLPDIVTVRTGITLPVEPAQIITGLVTAVLTELQPRSLDLALVDTGHKPVYRPARRQRQVLD